MRVSFVTASASLLAASASAQAGTTTLISLDDAGSPVASYCLEPSISDDGRYVAFQTNAQGFGVVGPYQIVVRDCATGLNQIASVDAAGVQSPSQCNAPEISGGGRFVAFDTYAPNLATGHMGVSNDVFVRDLAAGATFAASASTGGAAGNGYSARPSISRDGWIVAFESEATNLVAGDTNGRDDVFVRDLLNGTTVRASVATGGAQGNQDSEGAVVSPDGRFVAFYSAATTLVAGDTNSRRDVFVRDLASGALTRESLGVGGVQPNGDSYPAAFSADNRVLVYTTRAYNLVPGPATTSAKAIALDRTNGTYVWASPLVVPGPLWGDSTATDVSHDGRFVCLQSDSPRLVAGDTNGTFDAFVYDLRTSAMTRVSVATSGAEGHGSTGGPRSTGDGRFVVFSSGANDLVPGDTNPLYDIFLHDFTGPQPEGYCTSATTSNGCTPSISASANPRVSQSAACVITVANVDGQRTGTIFYGLAPLAQPWCASGGTSYRCVQAPLQQTGRFSSGGTQGACDGALVLDWNAYQSAHASALGSPWMVGAKAYVQGWFRDPGSCKTTSASNAVELTYQP